VRAVSVRRVFVPSLLPGVATLAPDAAHHLRDVLRADVGDAVELFDASGKSARATLVRVDRDAVEARVKSILDAPAGRLIVVASAVPKADRADWLVEKLCELGVARWVPLRTARSVVHPEGKKTERWERIAIEAAKQSKRSGVMAIAPLTSLGEFLKDVDPATTAVLSTREARPLATLPATTLLVGPEGGWTDEELAAFESRGIASATLGTTVLRIETAAIVGAGIASTTGRF
jgi:16S rRNA (uracil1498-N3)-methyltransferase